MKRIRALWRLVGGAGRRPPPVVIVASSLAAAVALASWSAAVVALVADEAGAVRGAWGLLWLGGVACFFIIACLRRRGSAWGAVLTLGVVAGVGAVVAAAVALARRSSDAAWVAVSLGAGAAIALTAFLRRPARDWFGFACEGCGRIRWPMRSEAARRPCWHCGISPGRPPAPPLRLARPLGALVWVALIGFHLAGELDGYRARVRRRAALAESQARIRIAGWTEFRDAVDTLEWVTGTSPVELAPGNCARDEVPGSEGRAFVLESGVAERILEGSHLTFRTGGLYLFRCRRGAANGSGEDILAVMATRDPREVIRKIGTGAPRSGLAPHDVVGILEALAREASFELTEIGVDYVAGRFDEEPADVKGIAEKLVVAAPALARLTSVDELAEELRRDGKLYLWWPEPEGPAGPGAPRVRTRAQ